MTGACELVPILPEQLGVILDCEAVLVQLMCVEQFTVNFNMATGATAAPPTAGQSIVSPLPNSTTFTVFNGSVPNIGQCDALFWANHFFKVYEELTATEALLFNSGTFTIDINGEPLMKESSIEEATKCWPCVVAHQPATAPARYVVGVMNPRSQCESIFIANDDVIRVQVTLPPGLGDVLMSFNIVFGRYTTRPTPTCLRRAAEVTPTQVVVPLRHCPPIFTTGNIVAVPGAPPITGAPSPATFGVPTGPFAGPMGT